MSSLPTSCGVSNVTPTLDEINGNGGTPAPAALTPSQCEFLQWVYADQTVTDAEMDAQWAEEQERRDAERALGIA